MRNGVKFVPHVHPETYSANDPLDWRRAQLHTKAATCELTSCTWPDHYDDDRERYVELAKALRAEIAAANRAAKNPADGPQANTNPTKENNAVTTKTTKPAAKKATVTNIADAKAAKATKATTAKKAATKATAAKTTNGKATAKATKTNDEAAAKGWAVLDSERGKEDVEPTPAMARKLTTACKELHAFTEAGPERREAVAKRNAAVIEAYKAGVKLNRIAVLVEMTRTGCWNVVRKGIGTKAVAK